MTDTSPCRAFIPCLSPSPCLSPPPCPCISSSPSPSPCPCLSSSPCPCLSMGFTGPCIPIFPHVGWGGAGLPSARSVPSHSLYQPSSCFLPPHSTGSSLHRPCIVPDRPCIVQLLALRCAHRTCSPPHGHGPLGCTGSAIVHGKQHEKTLSYGLLTVLYHHKPQYW